MYCRPSVMAIVALGIGIGIGMPQPALPQAPRVLGPFTIIPQPMAGQLEAGGSLELLTVGPDGTVRAWRSNSAATPIWSRTLPDQGGSPRWPIDVPRPYDVYAGGADEVLVLSRSNNGTIYLTVLNGADGTVVTGTDLYVSGNIVQGPAFGHLKDTAFPQGNLAFGQYDHRIIVTKFYLEAIPDGTFAVGAAGPSYVAIGNVDDDADDEIVITTTVIDEMETLRGALRVANYVGPGPPAFAVSDIGYIGSNYSPPVVADVVPGGRKEILVTYRDTGQVAMWSYDGISQMWTQSFVKSSPFGGKVYAPPIAMDWVAGGNLEVVAGTLTGVVFALTSSGATVGGFPHRVGINYNASPAYTGITDPLGFRIALSHTGTDITYLQRRNDGSVRHYQLGRLTHADLQ